jgi:hypothetical protein
MEYRKGYKYQLHKDEVIVLGEAFRTVKPIKSDLIELFDNVLVVKEHYAWDGASGPTKDTDDTMTASLCHDALYQLMRKRLLPHSLWKQADKELMKLLKKNGMPLFRRTYWNFFLSKARGKHASPKNVKKIYSVK